MKTEAAIAVQVVPVGVVSGAAWLAPVDGGALELTAIAKLVLSFTHEGVAVPIPPEPPGWNARQPAPEETSLAGTRKLIVRGGRAFPGRVVLRRSNASIVEVEVEPGVTLASKDLESTLQTTISGRRGEEWLVAEGLDAPSARRWCKVPKLGVVATWSIYPRAPERILLMSRLSLVDVAHWSIGFVLRGTRRMARGEAPRQIQLVLTDLAQVEPPDVASARPAAGGPTGTAQMPPLRELRQRTDEMPSPVFADTAVLAPDEDSAGTKVVHVGPLDPAAAMPFKRRAPAGELPLPPPRAATSRKGARTAPPIVPPPVAPPPLPPLWAESSTERRPPFDSETLTAERGGEKAAEKK